MDFSITQNKELHFVVVVNGVCVATFADFGSAMMADKIDLIAKKQEELFDDVSYGTSRINKLNADAFELRQFVDKARENGMYRFLNREEIADSLNDITKDVKNLELSIAERQAEYDKLAFAINTLRNIVSH